MPTEFISLYENNMKISASDLIIAKISVCAVLGSSLAHKKLWESCGRQNAEARTLSRQLEALKQDDFRNLLQKRGDISKVRKKVRERSLIDRNFSRISDYLNSLKRPELNYEGIQRYFAKLFHDPQARLEA
jgi:hypothetical protein